MDIHTIFERFIVDTNLDQAKIDKALDPIRKDIAEGKSIAEHRNSLCKLVFKLELKLEENRIPGQRKNLQLLHRFVSNLCGSFDPPLRFSYLAAEQLV